MSFSAMVSKEELFDKCMAHGVNWPPVARSAACFAAEQRKARAAFHKRFLLLTLVCLLAVVAAYFSGIMNLLIGMPAGQGLPPVSCLVVALVATPTLLYFPLRLVSSLSHEDSPQMQADIEMLIRCKFLGLDESRVPVVDTEAEYQAWKREYESYRGAGNRPREIT